LVKAKTETLTATTQVQQVLSRVDRVVIIFWKKIINKYKNKQYPRFFFKTMLRVKNPGHT